MSAATPRGAKALAPRRRPRHRATLGERATASTLAPVLLVILSAVLIVMGAATVRADPSALSGPGAHTPTPAAPALQSLPVVPSSVPAPPVTIDRFTVSH